MNDREREALLEAATTAYRELGRDGRPVPPAAWWDLAPQDLDALFRRQLAARAIEQALDPEGLSTTARAVLARS